jgi:hypothetical protein
MSRSQGLHAEAVVSSVTVDLTATERDYFDQMRRMTLVTSDANLVRIALWRHAKHLSVDCGADVFACRHPGAAVAKAKRIRRLRKQMGVA